MKAAFKRVLKDNTKKKPLQKVKLEKVSVEEIEAKRGSAYSYRFV